MEAHLTAAGEDFLVGSLSFKQPSNTAAYVQDTRQVSYFPESGDRFDTVSSKVIRFRLADHAFLEASSCKFGFTITNLGNQHITPLAQPMSMFRRAILFAASQCVDYRMELATKRQSHMDSWSLIYVLIIATKNIHSATHSTATIKCWGQPKAAGSL